MEIHYLTPEGKAELEEKLKYYKTIRRPEILDKINLAKSYGDLSENSEYDAAREQQAQIEEEIKEMENILLSCQIIKKKDLSCDTVTVGLTVDLYDEEFDEEVSFKILGSTESNPEKGIISNISPVGAALLGHKKGDRISLNLPTGPISYKILNIRI